MNDVIINGLFLLGAAAVGGVLAIVASRSTAEISRLKQKNERLHAQIERLLKQIEAYHLLEDAYAEAFSTLHPPKAIKTVKEEFRDKVVVRHQCVRPKMTANEARQRLESF